LHYFSQKKQKALHTTKQEQQQIEVYTNEFLFSTSQQNIHFFYNLLKKKHHPKFEKPFLVLTKKNAKIALFPYYKKRKLTMDSAKNLTILAKQNNITKLIVCCKSCEQEVLNFSKQLKPFQLLVLDQKQTYLKLLKPFEHYPTITAHIIEETKLTRTQLLHLLFHKKRTKSYLFSGTILMLSSVIVPYNLYYIIFGSLLYFMALFSYFNVNFNKKLPENMLEEED
jgi:hypothetical protein